MPEQELSESECESLRRKWRVGEREEERERESVLEEELWSFMKTLRLPNLAKLLPRALNSSEQIGRAHV